MSEKNLTIDDVLGDSTKEVQSLQKAQKRVGRRKSKDAKRNRFLVMLDDDLFEKLNNETEKLDMSRNEFIENLIKNYFKSDEKGVDKSMIVLDFLSSIDKKKIGDLSNEYLKKRAKEWNLEVEFQDNFLKKIGKK